MANPQQPSGLDQDPLWYKDAVIYEAHVRAFYDSNSDGMGDFRGLAQKLDYLQDLGVTAIWLLPFFPSPWKDDGYDIADFRTVHPAYGTLRDFQNLIKEAHRRGLRIITELVINHTSDQHEWFQKSRRAAPGSSWRNFYVWSDSPDKYAGTRIIFKDFEPSNWSWDPVAKSYFWHRFYSHQPDLNFDNPTVRRSVMHILDYWADMGVDGFRLDAIPYLFEREGTSCENLPETHEFLKELRRHLDERFPNRMLLSEANMWPEDAVAYMGNGDECHMNFHFPLMPRLFMALRLEDRLPIVEILNRTPALPETCQWAMFLRNHDELTLEMVTDEERDYMYRMYASDTRARINLGIRRRLAPLLQNDRSRIEVMNALLLSMPGTPVLYYGDEIGMGDNVYLGDRNGVRTPMQWSPDRNAGFSAANPQQLYLPVNIDPAYHYEAVNVESQQDNPNSLLNWTKRAIAMRKQYKAFGRGTFEFVDLPNQRVLAYLRRYEDEIILVIANLSRFAQPAHLDLHRFQGYTPVEVFGRTDFPVVTAEPYPITLGPNSFYWFSLEKREAGAPLWFRSTRTTGGGLPTLHLQGKTFEEGNLPALAAVLPRYLQAQRWFRSKERRFRAIEITDILSVSNQERVIAIVRTEFTTGDPETYVIPLGVASGDAATAIREESTDALIATISAAGGSELLLFDASVEPAFQSALLDTFLRRRRFIGRNGTILAHRGRDARAFSVSGDLKPKLLSQAEFNTAMQFGNRFVLKLLRAVEPGIHPGVEMGRFLTEERSYPYAPPFLGHLEYQPETGEATTVAILDGFVPNETDGWRYTKRELDAFMQRLQTSPVSRAELDKSAPEAVYTLNFALSDPPTIARELIGPVLEFAEMAGKRTAELHLTLVSDPSDPAFAPEPFNDFYRQALFNANTALTSRRLEFLRQRLSDFSPEDRDFAEKVLSSQQQILTKFRAVYDLRIASERCRFHGRLHLGHMLVQENNVFIFDFEGDPELHISERRIKRCPLRDVSSMLMSFGYAAQSVVRQSVSAEGHEEVDRTSLRAWARFWYAHVGAAFIRGYWRTARHAPYMPKTLEHQQVLLQNYLLERALLDIRSDINDKPELRGMQFRVILHLLGDL